jgi:hypothetical protein
MPIQIGQIVGKLIPNELAQITKVQYLGSKISLNYTGKNSNISGNRVITAAEAEALEIHTTDGTFNFKGDPTKFALFAEAERINSAYQFDPLFAVNCSIVDPLPHQVEYARPR